MNSFIEKKPNYFELISNFSKFEKKLACKRIECCKFLIYHLKKKTKRSTKFNKFDVWLFNK